MSSDRPDQSFASLFEQSTAGAPRRRKPRVGAIVAASVVQVGKDAVFVEFDAQEQGFIDAADLRDPDGVLKAAVGDTLYARIVAVDSEQAVRLAPATASSPSGAANAGEVVKVAVGQTVQGEVTRVESYGIFLQISGTRGRVGRGLAPTAELGVPRGADLRKAFPLGTKLKAKVIELSEGKMRLSLRALKDDEERAQFSGFREQERAASPQGFGTFADLIKARKPK